MNGSRGSLTRAASFGGAGLALALVTACASRTSSADSAAALGSAPNGASSTAVAAAKPPLPSGSPPSSELASSELASSDATTAPAAPISCTATVSNPTPKRGMATHVIVQTVSGAQVSVIATSASSAIVVPQRVTNAGADGRADLVVAAKSAGEPVAVHLRASKAGATATCATSFTPVDLPHVTDSPGLPPIQVTTQPLPPAGADT